MILAAVFAAGVTILGSGILLGWWMRGDCCRDEAYDEAYEEGYRDAVRASRWLAGDTDR